MDKFFIQAAFKSLDDIDKEENKEIKKALIESRLKEKKKREKKYPLGKGEHLNTCAGDPDVNTAAFNHTTSINNSSSTTGLGEDIEKQKLEEKIPKELKNAYRRNNPSLYASRLDRNNPENRAIKLGDTDDNYGDSDMRRNQSPIDFENAEYKIISKEEAHEYEKPRNRWHLILYYKSGVVNAPQALRFDRTGKPLEKFEFYLRRDEAPLDSKGKAINLSTSLPISLLIEKADIIYYTDELDHLNDKYFKDLKKEDDPNADVRGVITYYDKGKTPDEERAFNTFNNLEFDDMSEYEKRKWIIRRIKSLERDLNMKLYYDDSTKEKYEKKIKLLKRLLYKNISPAEYKTLETILMTDNPENREFPINPKLARVIALKNSLKKKIERFKEKAPLTQDETGYTSNWGYKYYNEQITKLKEQIKEIEQKIKGYEERLSSLDKDALNKRVEDEVDELGAEIEKINDELTSYGLKSVLKEGGDKTKVNLNASRDKEKLEEKIPKEVKAAYKNSIRSTYADNLLSGKEPADPKMIHAYRLSPGTKRPLAHNISPIDLENAEYRVISKEEARQYNKPSQRWHLILLFTDRDKLVSAAPQAIRFSKEGKPLSKVTFESWYYNDIELPERKWDGRTIKSSAYLPVSLLIDLADKIYYTDELDHLNDEYFSSFDSSKADMKVGLDPDAQIYYNTYNHRPMSGDVARARDFMDRVDTSDAVIPSYFNGNEWDRKQNIYDRIDNIKSRGWRYEPTSKEGKAEERKLKRLQRLLYKQITPDEYVERTQIEEKPDPSDRQPIMNRDLVTAIFLKNRLKDKVATFKKMAEHSTEGEGYTQDTEYRRHINQIKLAEDRIKELEQEIKNLQSEINEHKREVDELDKEKLNSSYDEKVKQIFDEIERINSKLVGYGAPSVLKEGVDKTKFNLKDPEDIEEAKKIREEGESKEDLVIIHPVLNHKKPSPGNAIITCKDCDEVFYLDKKELKQDPEDPDTYNKDMQCENCGAQDGYDYVGDVALKDTASAEDAIKEREAGLEDDFAEESTEEPAEELEPIDDVEEPEEIIEESFDGLVNKYLNKVYENIASYKTTSVTQTDRNMYLIEGVFSLNDDKELKTSFLLESVEKKNNNFVLKGSNKILCEAKEPFEIRGRVDNKKLVFESFKYNYVETIDKKQYLVEGLEENK